MRYVPKRLIKRTTHLALLTCLFFSFLSCSQLSLNTKSSKSTISFSIASPRAAISLAEDEQLFIDLELQGEFTDIQSIEITSQENLSFTIDEVPVGKNVSVSARIYIPYEGEKLVLYEGKSDTKTIMLEEENIFEIKLSVSYNSFVETSSKYIVNRNLSLRLSVTTESLLQIISSLKMTLTAMNLMKPLSGLLKGLKNIKKQKSPFMAISWKMIAKTVLSLRPLKQRPAQTTSWKKNP